MSRKKVSQVLGCGYFVPERVVTNEELTRVMSTSDEWIRQRAGIRERRFAPDNMGCADLACEASLRALESARISTVDIDCIVLATLSPDYHFPGSGVLLGRKLGLPGVPAIDIRAQCSGFIYSLSVADSFIRAGQFARVLVVGSEKHSMALDFTDRGRDVAVLFGDGAGAVVLGPSTDESGVLSTHLHADGQYAEALWLECPGSAHVPWISQEMVDLGRVFPRMEGRHVFKHALDKFPAVIREALEHNSLCVEDIDLFIFHQANLRIIEHVAGQLDIRPEHIFNNIQRYGNTTAGSIPIALCEAVDAGLLNQGALVLMCSFGSGFTWASALLRW